MNTPPWIILLSVIDQLPDSYVAENWADRIQICYSCDKIKEARNKFVCGECNCPVDKKALIKTEQCPIGKW